MLQLHSIRDTGYFRHQYIHPTLQGNGFLRILTKVNEIKYFKWRNYMEKSINAKTYSYSLSRFIQEQGSKLKIINETKIDFEFSLVIRKYLSVSP